MSKPAQQQIAEQLAGPIAESLSRGPKRDWFSLTPDELPKSYTLHLTDDAPLTTFAKGILLGGFVGALGLLLVLFSYAL